MHVKEEEKIGISTLEYLAIKYSESDITNQEIRQNDIGPLVWQELKEMLKQGENINIQVLGKVRTGKSTVMCMLVKTINEWLDRPMELKFVKADQYEFGRATLEEINNICYGVDELSTMEETSFNATIESKYLEHFSDVQAVRGIHRIACSPRSILDRNAELILQVLNKDVKRKTTKCLVYYRRITPTTEIIQLIGSMDINVSSVIETEWFKRYYKRKIAKIELMYKEGIFQMREMHFAKILIEAYDQLSGLCKIMKPNKDIIEGKIKVLSHEEKIPITAFALEYLKSGVNSLISQEYAIQQMNHKLKRTTDKTEKEKIQKTIESIEKSLTSDLTKQDKLVQINKKYSAI